MIVLDLSILNQKGTPMFNSDLTANRPAAGIVGRIFIATDSPYGIFRDTGSAWDQISGASTFSGSLATGQVAFGSATNTISGTNNLFWDNANNRFGVNNSVPLFSLDITGTARITGATLISPVSTINTYNYFSSFNVVNDGPASIAVDRFSNNTTSPHFNLRKSRGTTTTPLIIQTNDELGYVGFWGHDGTNFQRNGIILVQAQNVSGTTITPVMRFGVGANAGLSQYYINLHNTGNTIFGPSSTADTGQRLQVIGDTFLKGSGATSATSALTIVNSSSVQSFIINNSGGAMFGINVPSGGNVKLETDGVFRAWTQLEIGSFGTVAINTSQFTKTASGGSYFEFLNNASYTAVGGTYYFLQLRNSVNPTSGNAIVNGLNLNFTINQTGGANGITRGLYVDPTLTAAANWRSIEWSNNTGWGIYGAGTALSYFGGSVGIKTTAPYVPSTFSLDVNGGLLVKNTAGTTAQITLINADPSTGGNNGFLVQTVGGTSGGSYVDFQGYYGTSIVGSTALRLNPAGGAVIVNSTTNTGEQLQLTGTLRINGQSSGTAGGSSGQHLIINLDGTTYKIALLNP